MTDTEPMISTKDKNAEPFVSRRTALAAAWSLPVVALAVATPAAAASQTGCDPLAFIPSTHGSLYGVQPTLTGFLVLTKPRSSGGQGNAIDVTVRVNGVQVLHVNLVTQGKNPGDNQQLYTPGDVVEFNTIGKNLKLSDGDFMQVADVHLAC